MAILRWTITAITTFMICNVQLFDCHSLKANTESERPNRLLTRHSTTDHVPFRLKRSVDNGNIVHQDTIISETLLKDFLTILFRALANKMAAELVTDMDDERVRKRKFSWQELRGPIQVETRSSFGSRLEPENGKLGDNGLKVMKAMRYG